SSHRACRNRRTHLVPSGHNGPMNRRARRGARPEVTLGNFAAVYDFYGPGRRRDAFAHPLLRLVTAIWAPRIEITAEVAARLRELHDSGTGVVLAANHPSGHDALVLASAVWDARVRFLSGGTGLAKDSLFSGPTRPLFEYTGTIPVFRAKNYPDVPADTHVAAAERRIEVCSDRLGAGGGAGRARASLFSGPTRPLFGYTGTIPVFRAKNYPDVPADTHVAAAERMIEVCSDRLGAGGVVLSFVEGTNSAPEDLRALRPESVKRGVGQIVHGALSAGRPVALLPVGISYQGRERSRVPPRRAMVRAGTPVLWGPGEPVPTVDEVREAARTGINSA